jgi:hypothetical protein
MTDLVKVALIGAIATVMVGLGTFTIGLLNYFQGRSIGGKVDGILSKSLEDKDTAQRKADHSEGFREGSESERKP